MIYQADDITKSLIYKLCASIRRPINHKSTTSHSPRTVQRRHNANVKLRQRQPAHNHHQPLLLPTPRPTTGDQRYTSVALYLHKSVSAPRWTDSIELTGVSLHNILISPLPPFVSNCCPVRMHTIIIKAHK